MAVAVTVIAAAGGVAAAADARTGAYPTRPVRFIVAQSAGGNADFVARMVAGELAKQLGQQFVVDNRGGGGGGVRAAELVVRAAPGATLDAATVRAWLSERLAAFKIPRYIEFTTDPLPRNAMQKILKRDIRAAFIEGKAGT